MNPTIESFFNAWIARFNVSDILTVTTPDYSLLGDGLPGTKMQPSCLEDGFDANSQYPLVIGDLPIGMHPIKGTVNGASVSLRQNWLYLAQASAAISPNGYGIFLVEPNALCLSGWPKFETILAGMGLYLHAALRTPAGMCNSIAMRPMLVVLSHEVPTNLFVAEIEDKSQVISIVENFADGESKGSFSEGLFLAREDFSTFDKYLLAQQMERLETQYKSYREDTLKNLAVSINLVRTGKSHIEHNNSIYFPTVGNSPVISSLQNATLKHQNYAQVVLTECVMADYAAAFYASDFGKLIRESLYSGSTIPHITKKALGDASIALPPIDEQREIASTLSKLQELQDELDKFKEELALNPTNVKSVVGQLDSMLDVVGSLTLSDKVRSLARMDESKILEFKESLSLDLRKITKEKYIEEAVLKTIVAFLNTEGGELLVGVSDDHTIPGLSREIEKFHKSSLDKLLLHFKNLIKNQIGAEFYPSVEYQVVNIDNAPVLYVNCKASKSPCYLKGNDFYVRTNPATDCLNGPELVAYVTSHFSNQENA